MSSINLFIKETKFTFFMFFIIALLPFYHSKSDPKQIAIIGTGYVGLVTGVCFAHHGHRVICADTDKQKIKTLREGKSPIYEPGLDEMLSKVIERGTISFTDDTVEAIRKSEVIFIAVSTPMKPNGQADVSAVKNVAKVIGQNLNEYKVICTKSTVPIGMTHKVKVLIKDYSRGKYPFDVVSNPEFLKEGSAIQDFLYPYRIVLGIESKRARGIMDELYQHFQEQKVPFLYTRIVSAEMIKYGSNAFLATKIAFVNELADLCESVGADIIEVAKGIGTDPRIGSQFLKPGPGFGGSCFPKDSHELVYKGKCMKHELKILESVLIANEEHKNKIFRKLLSLAGGSIRGKTIAVLGLTFKANTDDIRSSPAIVIIKHLQNAGAYIKAYDPNPMAMNNMRKLIPTIKYCDSLWDAVEDSDAAIVLTEWEEFKTMDLKRVKDLMHAPMVFDARNILNVKQLKSLGFTYRNVGNAHVI